METIQAPSKTELLKAYRQTDDKGKELLESLFGKIAPEKITEKVLTFEDACEVIGIKPEDVLHASHSAFLDKHINSINAYCRLIVITEALNEEWKPNWDDEDEYKYYPWFYFDQPGFRLDGVGDYFTGASVGSRLCFRDSETAQYAATQFLDIYKEFMTF